MPELPEVETTLRGVAPFIVGQTIVEITVRNPRLRYLIPDDFSIMHVGERILSMQRRAKYLMIYTDIHQIIIHLGMSGSLRITDLTQTIRKHDHVILTFSNQQQLRFHDPRRFGLIQAFPLAVTPTYLQKLAPEPLSNEFHATYLWQMLQRSKRSIKISIMDQAYVVGVGNIYASESLFLSRIHPETPSNTLDLAQCALLITHIKQVLQDAIKQGGTTLRDFINPAGEPGYFAQTLRVYGRQHEPCYECGELIIRKVIGQRATYWCPYCQSTPL